MNFFFAGAAAVVVVPAAVVAALDGAACAGVVDVFGAAAGAPAEDGRGVAVAVGVAVGVVVGGVAVLPRADAARAAVSIDFCGVFAAGVP